MLFQCTEQFFFLLSFICDMLFCFYDMTQYFSWLWKRKNIRMKYCIRRKKKSSGSNMHVMSMNIDRKKGAYRMQCYNINIFYYVDTLWIMIHYCVKISDSISYLYSLIASIEFNIHFPLLTRSTIVKIINYIQHAYIYLSFMASSIEKAHTAKER